ncbi:MAG: hypothetical protein AAF702_30130 [Chloroflexota bacterium]
MINNLRAAWQRHNLFWMLFLLFVVFRVLAILLFRPGGFISDASDYDFYMTWGQLTPMGYRAYENLWTAYPPLFPLIMLPIFEWSSRIPPWIEPRFFFHTLFGLTLLLFEAANLILIYRLAHGLVNGEQLPVVSSQPSATDHRLPTTDYRPPTTDHQLPTTNYQPPAPTLHAPLLSALLYALLFTPLYTMLGWFEPMPLFFMLIGLELLLSQSRMGWLGSAVAAALGFLTKLTPILLLPIAVRWLGSRLSWQAARYEWFDRQASGNLLRPVIYVLIFVGGVVAIGYPVVRQNPALALSSFQVQGLRPPWQSIWALIDGFYGYGLVPIDMRNLVSLETLTWESRIPWRLVSLAFVGIYLWLYTRPYDWERPRTPVAFAGISVILLFLYSKGWSPQFLVWVLAFVVLLLPTWRGMAVVSVLALTNVIESHVFLVLLPDERWILWYTVAVRTLLLVLLIAEFLGQIWPHPERARQIRLTNSWLSWSAIGVGLLAIPVAMPAAAEAYEERRWREHPCQEAISFLREQAGWPDSRVVTEQVGIWQDFYPWLAKNHAIDIVDVYSPLDESPEVVALARLNALADEGPFWWVHRPGEVMTSGRQMSSASSFFAQPNVHIPERYMFGECTLTQVILEGEGEERKRVQAVGGPIELVDMQMNVSRPHNTLYLILYWQAEEKVGESYTVFTQLFDQEMTLIAQQDNLPVEGLAPTDTWEPGKLIRDPYRLSLPDDLAAGRYTLLVGMYQGGQRAAIEHGDGTRSDAMRFVVEMSD